MKIAVTGKGGVGKTTVSGFCSWELWKLPEVDVSARRM